MRMSKLVGTRTKEHPAGCVLDSHALMMRGGYLKGVCAGIYSQFLPLTRVCRKIEDIIREEMDALEGQEVLFPVALPGALWRESGRYESVGNELLRFRDRGGAEMVLGMTHEEAAVHLVRDYGVSYGRYPFFIYQIQTKFRDEARARGGLIRVREFRMKDGYSFHTSQGDLEQFFARCLRAYERIFARVGLPQVQAIASDSGMMGGEVSYEFTLLTPAGEDSVGHCPCCGRWFNLEAAEGAACPACGAENPVISRGIEVGHIFQLGDKYTKAMGMRYTDESGAPCTPVMGCYGIGIGRLAASVCEASHDSHGPIWPVTVAPWQVHLCALRAGEGAVREAAERLYVLLGKGRTLYDERDVSPGVQLADADLLGAPVRVVLGPRDLAEGLCQVESRDRARRETVPIAQAAETVERMLAEMRREIEGGGLERE